jgi:hypothetical protein
LRQTAAIGVPSPACHNTKAIFCCAKRDFFIERSPPGQGGWTELTQSSIRGQSQSRH